MGGGGGGSGYDAAYNARLASVAEAQQRMADEQMDFWRSDYKPMEQAQIKANQELIPSETAYQKEQLGQLTQQLKDTAPVKQQLLTDALAYKPDSIVDMAVNDALQAYAGTRQMTDRNLASRGVNPSSSQYVAMNRDNSVDLAKTMGLVKTQARNLAETEQRNRLFQALSANNVGGGNV
jgi:uncharacterized membrane protein YdfJ with MMPL/SSD domain